MKKIIYMLLALTLLISAVGGITVSAEIPTGYPNYTHNMDTLPSFTLATGVTVTKEAETVDGQTNNFARCKVDKSNASGWVTVKLPVHTNALPEGDYTYTVSYKFRPSAAIPEYLANNSSRIANGNIFVEVVAMYDTENKTNQTITRTRNLEVRRNTTEGAWTTATLTIGPTNFYNSAEWDWNFPSDAKNIRVQLRNAYVRLFSQTFDKLTDDAGFNAVASDQLYVDIDDWTCGTTDTFMSTNYDKRYSNGKFEVRASWTGGEKVKVLFAEYTADDLLVDAGVTEHDTKGANTFREVATPAGFAPKPGNIVKIYVWKNNDKLKPLTRATTYTVPAATE